MNGGCCFLECYELVMPFFDGDLSKTKLWFESLNPMLGGVSPMGMIDLGRGDKLLAFIECQLEENYEKNI